MPPPVLQIGRTNVYQGGYTLSQERLIGTSTIGALVTIPLPDDAEVDLLGPSFFAGRIMNDQMTREVFGLSGSIFLTSPRLFGNFRATAGLQVGFDLVRPELTEAFHMTPRVAASVGLRAAPFMMKSRDAFGTFDISRVDNQTFFGLSGGITFDAF